MLEVRRATKDDVIDFTNLNYQFIKILDIG